MKMLGFGFKKTCAGVISQARRAGRDVSSRWNDERRLGRILELPDLLGHPAGKRPLFEADFAVERVHRLVFHFPAGISPFDDINDARGITLVGIIIHRESITEFIEGDFLRITQTEVDDFEVRAVGFEAEDRPAIMRIIFLPFLRGEIETTVADGTPDAAVGSDGEAIHIMAREGNADTEAFLNHLTFGGDAVVLGVMQHPEFRNTGEVDVVIPHHDAGTRTIEHVVEFLGEDFLGRESAVGLLAT